jgi:hemerythrin-like domain-containing protein
MKDGSEARRTFLRTAAGAALLAGCAAMQPKGTSATEKHEEGEEISPIEDLMREHGVLNRVLLVEEECARRIEAGGAPPEGVLTGAASIIRRFIEDYHEKLEEEHLFPRFERAQKHLDLVRTLRAQHEAGRRLTDRIASLSTAKAPLGDADRAALSGAIGAFVRMYRPHEAREDTVLFPALHSIVSEEELDRLGEIFEDREHALFGEHGFEAMVAEVEKLEQALGIFDLAAFTPT